MKVPVSSVVVTFVLTWLATAVVFGLIVTIGFYLQDDQYAAERLAAAKSVAAGYAQGGAQIVNSELDRVVGDLRFLAGDLQLHLVDGKPKNELGAEWQLFLAQMGNYDAISYVSADGVQILSESKPNPQAMAVAYQFSSDPIARTCFDQAMTLAAGDMYLGKLQLAQDNGVIRQPAEADIHWCMPIQDTQGKRAGALVMIYDAGTLLQQFRLVVDRSENPIYLLNMDGYWISGESAANEWGWQYPGRQALTFQNRYGAAWGRIQAGDSSFQTANGLFTSMIIPVDGRQGAGVSGADKGAIHAAEKEWLVVSVIPAGSPAGKGLARGWQAFFQRSGREWLNRMLQSALFALIVAAAIAYRQRFLESMRHLADHDALTGVLSRRAGLERLGKLYSSGDRRHKALAVCYMDVDGLKEVNDLLGHQQGDKLLVEFVEVLKHAIREEDYIFRAGGDEFAAVLPETSREQAEAVWARIIKRFAVLNATVGRQFLLSASHGIVSGEDAIEGHVEQWLKLADERMYEEKRRLEHPVGVIRGR